MNTKNKKIEVKVYDYFTMRKIAFIWLPVFSIAAYISASLESIRFIAMFVIVGSVYGLILTQMKKKAVIVSFSDKEFSINNETVLLSQIENYYICLPLNELFMLRLEIDDKNKILYIGKEYREQIENYLENVPVKKNLYDVYLKYSHLLLPFIMLFICAIAIKLQYFIKYN